MNRITFAAVLSIVLIVLVAVMTQSVSYAAESARDPAAGDRPGRYLFFFHNYYVEMKGPDGDCRYNDLLKAFTDLGFTVSSELRPKDVSVVEYAQKAAADVQALLNTGVAPEKIVIAGHSKGAVIALRVASVLNRPGINYVLLAGCGIKPLAKAYPDFALLQGNFLSLYATSDTIAGSCNEGFAQAKTDFSGREIALESPAGHQLFFSPAQEWLKPLSAWLDMDSKR